MRYRPSDKPGRSGAAGAAELWPRCPYCQSTNIAADGEYVCRDCGAVLGPVLMPPRQTPPARYKPAPLTPAGRRLMKILKEEAAGRENVKRVESVKPIKRRYLDMVKEHLDKIADALGAEVAAVALEIFQRLDKRVYQGKAPKVIAAALAYLAAERLGLHVRARTIARILNVSKYSVRDTAWRLRRQIEAR